MVNPTTLHHETWQPGLPESGETVVGGYPGLLDALHERAAPGTLVASPTGHVLASPTVLPAAPPGPLARFGLAVAINHPAAVAVGPPADRFADGLLDLHHDLLRAALRHALHHLGERTSGGTTLLNKQLVQGQLADVARSLAEDEVMPLQRRQGDRAARWRSPTARRHRAPPVDAARRQRVPGLCAGHRAAPGGRAGVYLHPGTHGGNPRGE